MPTVPLPLDRPALPLDLAPGGEVVLRGSYSSGLDGSVVDARATSWPAASKMRAPPWVAMTWSPSSR